MAPWTLYKEGKLDELCLGLSGILEAIRIITVLLSPVIPNCAEEVFRQLNIADREDKNSLEVKPYFTKNHVLGEPAPLFPRIQVS